LPTILVVDNDLDCLDTAQRALQEAGHKVEMTTSARAALALLAKVAVDAIVLEMLLPDMEGVETILQMQQRWPARPVVAMSGGGSMVSADHALRLAKAVGAQAVLHKPFSGADLLVAVDQALAA
jgi:DNA-binding NtrC family response regulator